MKFNIIFLIGFCLFLSDKVVASEGSSTNRFTVTDTRVFPTRVKKIDKNRSFQYFFVDTHSKNTPKETHSFLEFDEQEKN